MVLKLTDRPTTPNLELPLPNRPRRVYSVVEWLQLPERPRTELIGGLLKKMSPPTQNHWRIIRNITAALDPYVLSHDLGTVGGEIAVLVDGLTGKDGWIPDLAFAAKANPLKIGATWNGRPDWVLEVWAGTRKETKRINDKRLAWARAGIPELWEVIFYKGQQTIRVYQLNQHGEYLLVSNPTDLICSEVILGFCMTQAEIFARTVPLTQ